MEIPSTRTPPAKMKAAASRLLGQCLAVACMAIPSCAFYGHKAITAPCTHVIKTAKAPADVRDQDSYNRFIYQDRKGDFYAETWVCEAARSHDMLYFDRIDHPCDFYWKCVSAPKLAWVKLEKTSEKEYRIVAIGNKPADARKIEVNGDVSWHISKSAPFAVPCGSWRRPLSYACFAVVDVPVSVAANAVVVPCACVVGVVSFTPLAIPFRMLGEQIIGKSY